MGQHTTVVRLMTPVALAALEARRSAIEEQVGAYCARPDRTTRKGEKVVSQKFPRLATLLRTYLHGTVEDAQDLEPEDYDWLMGGVIDWLIANVMAVDIESEALKLTMEIVESGDRDQLLADIMAVFREAPQLEAGYRTHMTSWRRTIRARKPLLARDSLSFMVLEETMMLVWLALRPRWLQPPEHSYDDILMDELVFEGFDDPSSEPEPSDDEDCPWTGGLYLVKG